MTVRLGTESSVSVVASMPLPDGNDSGRAARNRPTSSLCPKYEAIKFNRLHGNVFNIICVICCTPLAVQEALHWPSLAGADLRGKYVGTGRARGPELLSVRLG